MSLKALRDRAQLRGPLLSALLSNPKVAKNTAKLGISTAVLHLAPGNMSGHEVCPKRSPGCSAACLHFAGSPVYQTGKTQSRIAKTKLFFRDRDLFMNILVLELRAHVRNATKNNLEAAARLNATSDICWEAKDFNLFPEVGSGRSSIIELFPTLQFYDYTALSNRRVPANYDLTFSLKEDNQVEAALALDAGMNVAAVFIDKLPPRFRLGSNLLPVIDGDEHDYRPADPRRSIVGLKAKGKLGKSDQTGFIARLAA